MCQGSSGELGRAGNGECALGIGEVRVVVNALGSQLVLVEGLQELSLVPHHLGVSGEVSRSPHATSALGSWLRFWCSMLGPPFTGGEASPLPQLLPSAKSAL